MNKLALPTCIDIYLNGKQW